MKRSCLFAAALFMAAYLFLGGCQTVPKIPEAVKPGMNKEQVLKAARVQPTYVSKYGATETWYFVPSKEHEGAPTYLVRFREDKVLEVSEESQEEAALLKTPKEKRANFPPDLGQQCEYDTDCVSKNCWLNKCAGPHNCFVFLGAQCVIDNDCCDGLCDNGTCKPKRSLLPAPSPAKK